MDIWRIETSKSEMKDIINGVLDYLIDPDPEYDDIQPILNRIVQLLINAQKVEE